MCHPDLTMLTGGWVAASDVFEHIELRTTSKSRCVNWEAIQSWAMSRYLNRGNFSIRAGPFDRYPLTETSH